jgi:hypothetical protein
MTTQKLNGNDTIGHFAKRLKQEQRVMYFKSSLELGHDVYYELRSKDAEGIYITVAQFQALADRIRDLDLDSIGELATDMHVMNIPIAANIAINQADFWKHLEPTHIRLGPEYKDVV